MESTAVVTAGANALVELTAEQRVEKEGELESVADEFNDRWRERGNEFARWIKADVEDLVPRVVNLQGVLFPEDQENAKLFNFLVERCHYSAGMAKFLISLRGVIDQLDELPFLTPHMLEPLAKMPEQFLLPVLKKEERFLGLAYDEMPITARGSDAASLMKFAKQLNDRVAYADKPAERERERQESEDPADRALREAEEEGEQAGLLLEGSGGSEHGHRQPSVVGGVSLFAHLATASSAWPTIQKSVIDDVCEGRITGEQLVDVYRFAVALARVLQQYVAKG